MDVALHSIAFGALSFCIIREIGWKRSMVLNQGITRGALQSWDKYDNGIWAQEGIYYVR